jgi:hypothetical protein
MEDEHLRRPDPMAFEPSAIGESQRLDEMAKRVQHPLRIVSLLTSSHTRRVVWYAT